MTTSTKRHVAQISNHGRVRVATEPLPTPGDGEVLVQAACSLISPGTELVAIKTPETDKLEEWHSFGYQSAGVVIATGEGCQLKAGQRVACMGANYAFHSDYVVVPHNLVVPISDEITFEEGAFSNLAVTALHALRRAQPEFGEHLAVFGLGAVGQIICQLATLSGTHVAVIDGVPMRRQVARSHGAEIDADPSTPDAMQQLTQWTRGYGVDAAFIAFGGDATKAIADIASLIKRDPDKHQRGRIVIVGGVTVQINFPVPLGNIDIRSASRTGPGYHDKAWERGQSYPDALVPWNTQRNLNEIFRFVEMKKLHLRPLVTDRVLPEQIGEACNRLVSAPQESLGVIVQWNKNL